MPPLASASLRYLALAAVVATVGFGCRSLVPAAQTTPVDPAALAVHNQGLLVVDAGQILSTLKRRRVQAMGTPGMFDNEPVSYRVRVEGPSMTAVASAPATWVDTGPRQIGFGGGGQAPALPSVSLAVPAGLNRVVSLEALDANGQVFMVAKALATIQAGQSNAVSFSPAADAAARVVEFLLHPDAGTNTTAWISYMTSNDVNAAFSRLINGWAGYEPTANTFTHYPPERFSSWRFAQQLNTDGPQVLTTLSVAAAPSTYTEFSSPVSLNAGVVLLDAGGAVLPVGSYWVTTSDAWDYAVLDPSGTNLTGMRPGTWTVTAQVQTPAGTRIGTGTVTVANPSAPPTVTLTLEPATGTGEASTVTNYGDVSPLTAASPSASPSTPPGSGMSGYPAMAYSLGKLYICDPFNNRILKFDTTTPSTRATVLAGTGMPGLQNGVLTNAAFAQPHSLAVDSHGNLFVADSANHVIREITLSQATPQVLTVAGSYLGYQDGNGTAARFAFPYALAMGPNDVLYVADGGDGRIRKIDTTQATFPVTTLAGGTSHGYQDGPLGTALFEQIYSLAADGAGNLYAADSNRIRKIATDGTVSTLAGSVGGFKDATGKSAEFLGLLSLAAAPGGNVYAVDFMNGRIRKITPAGAVTTLAGGADTAATASTSPSAYPTLDPTQPAPIPVGLPTPGTSLQFGMNLTGVVVAPSPGVVYFTSGTTLFKLTPSSAL